MTTSTEALTNTTSQYKENGGHKQSYTKTKPAVSGDHRVVWRGTLWPIPRTEVWGHCSQKIS